MAGAVLVALFTYTGPAGLVWPAVPVTPAPGDVIEWGDVAPDPHVWTPAPKKATATRRPDNADPEPATEPEPAPVEPAPSVDTAPAAENQE